jgi:hypothetical protein
VSAALAAKLSVLYFARIATVVAIAACLMKEGRNERARRSHASAYAATCAVTIDPYLVEYGIGSSFSMACIGGRLADR